MRNRIQRELLRSPSWRALAAAMFAVGPALLIGAPAVAQTAAAPTGAPSQLEEVIVTATKTGATKLQKTPLAVTALSADQLKTTQSLNIKDLVNYVPSLDIGAAKGNAIVFIRGIGSNNYFAGSDPDVTMQVDGVYIGRLSEVFNDFLDVGSIEVLRGPQGTLYGRNAVGGTINITSKTPTNTFTGDAQLTVGNYGLVGAQAYVSGPIVPDKLQGSVDLSYERHDGYLKNVDPTGSGNIDGANHGGLRVQLRYEPTSNIVATTRADLAVKDEHDDGMDTTLGKPGGALAGATIAASLVDNYHDVSINSPQYTRGTNGGISENIDAAINSNLSLNSITAYRVDDYTLAIDGDGTEVNDVTAVAVEDENQISQEFNLRANYSKFDAVAGLYYYREIDDLAINQNIYPAKVQLLVDARTSTEAEAAFAQATYHLTPDIGITVGYRYTAEQKHDDQTFGEFLTSPRTTLLDFIDSKTLNFDGATPKFGINWQITKDAMVYASATRGYKSGGFNYAASSAAALTFEPEAIWSYEVGAKTDWFDHRLRLNVTGFHYDYSNLQVQSLISYAQAIVSITNAAAASANGVEIELAARPAPDWKLAANATVMDATYTSFPNASVATGLVAYVSSDPRYSAAHNTFNAKGNYLDYAPRETLSVSAEHDWHLEKGEVLYLRAEYAWKDRTYFDATNANVLSQPAYGLVSVFAGYTSADGNWDVELFGKNLTNKGYLVAAQAANVPPQAEVGPPLTFGVIVGRHF